MKAEEIHIKMLEAKFRLIFAKKELKVNIDKSEELIKEALIFINEGLAFSTAYIRDYNFKEAVMKVAAPLVILKCPVCEQDLTKGYICCNPNCSEFSEYEF